MKRAVPVLLLPLLCLPCLPAAAMQPERDFRQDEVLVKYRDAASAPAVRSSLGLSVRRQLRQGRVELLSLPAITTVTAAIATLRQDPRVEYAEPNFRRRKRDFTPNDPLFPSQWALSNTGQANFVSGGPAGTPGADLDMLKAWDANGDGVPDRTGSSSVIVAVVDDGVETTHEDLAANIVPGYDFADNDNDPNPASNADTHGTLVAGCIGAVGNNGIGVAGVAWNAGIMPLRFDFDVASEVDALEFAEQHGASIVNASYGGPGFSQTESDAIQDLANQDILFVAAAGNDDSNIDRSQLDYPANYGLDNIVAAAAINRQGQIASFSQYGPLSIAVAAPGLQTVTTAIHNSYATGATGGVSGTSFSAPYVSGVAALIRSQYPDADYREVKARLIESGRNQANAQAMTTGGFVDANTALNLAAGPSLVVSSVAIDAAGNHALDPGETATLHVVVQNLWQDASGVSISGSADNGVSISGGSIALGDLAQDGTAAADFTVTAPASLSGHTYVHFSFTLTANAGGYSTTRQYTDEVSALAFGNQVSASFAGTDTDLYDEFQAWHVDVPTVTQRYLVIESNANADVDILVKYATPPQYDITLAADPENPPEGTLYCTSGTGGDCLDPDTYIGGNTQTGLERVCIANPAAGTYHIVAVNYSDLPSPLQYQLRTYTADSCSIPGQGHHGGSFGAGCSALLALAAAMRRRAMFARKTMPARA